MILLYLTILDYSQNFNNNKKVFTTTKNNFKCYLGQEVHKKKLISTNCVFILHNESFTLVNHIYN